MTQKESEQVEKEPKRKKKRKYLKAKASGVKTRVQWGKRGGPVRITVIIPREHFAKRLAKKLK